MRIVKAVVVMCIISFITLFSLPTAEAFGGAVTSPYGMRIHPIWGDLRLHNGADLGVEYGTALPALGSGTVGTGWDHGGYGRWLEITSDTPDSQGRYRRFLYAHLSGYASGLQDGSHVNQGDIIGYSGDTGGVTGPHLHIVTYFTAEYGDCEDPVPFMLAAGWDLSGDLSGNTYGEGDPWALGKKIPSITYDMDWAEYFKPSETLANAAKNVFDFFTKAMDHIKDNLRNILLTLCVLDLLWYLAKTCMELEPLTPQKFFSKLIRYGFFIAIWDSWRTIFKEVFFPLYEDIATLYSGSTVTVEDMLSFDSLYNQLSQILGNNLSLSWTFNPITGVPGLALFIACNILVFLILIISFVLCLYILVRISYFYIVCIFGVLGLPLSMIPVLNVHAGTMLGNVLSYALELSFTASMFSIMLNFLQTLKPVEADSAVGLLLFLIQFGFVTYMVINCSKWSRHFTGRFSL